MQRAYETMYILRPQLEEEAVDAVIAKVTDHITKNGGSVEKTEKRGRKRLAYEVKDHRDGFYVLSNFNADTTSLVELERMFKLNEDVIRHIVVRAEA
ncbi:30S ribosomal protein S6 [bacterium]|nr:30S ribosomal protein S6 [bacterium]